MRTKFLILTLIIPVVLPVSFILPQDSVKTYTLPSVEIVAKKEINLYDNHKYGLDYNSNLLDKNGFSVVRRGTNFTQDVYSEGFKRGDVKVVIDGEQYHNACPNRMDSPASRINPLEMKSVDLSKSSATLNSGIYGKVQYHRADLNESFRVKSFFIGNIGAQNDMDLSTSIEDYKTNLVLRYSTGKPYQNGDGKKFNELYGYKDNFKYNFGSGSIRHNADDFSAGTSFTFSENVSFPYLMMDEIRSKVFTGFFEYKGNKAYFNYTDHLMNNSLRTSAMFMESEAKNFTAGITGSFYEVVYRHWNADNVIKNPMMNVNIVNKQLPEITQLSAAGSEKFEIGFLNVAAKAGVQYFSAGDNSRMNFYKTIFPDPKDNRFFISAGLNASYSSQLTDDLLIFISAEGAAEAPEAEQLFIAVQRPMTNPDWSGNPTLDQPVRSGLRTSFDYKFIHLEGFANYVFNYVETIKMSAMKNYLTYDNIEAALFGVNLSATFSFLETSLSYLYGENLSASTALSEISPLSVTSKVIFPEFSGINLYASHRYENSQKRINNQLNEIPSASWNILGIGAGYKYSNLNITFEVDNLLDHNYSRHLSYTRNPFSSGAKVYEPGRTFRLTLYYSFQ